MGNEDLDLVTISKSVKKESLLERYDIPIENLSYEYITLCTRAKELERIVVILRSGEEGTYPDLIKHAEERLAAVNPQSRVFRVAEPALSKEKLTLEKKKNLENDMNEWLSEMKLRDADLQEGRALSVKEPNSLPDIRQTKLDESKNKEKSSFSLRNHRRIAACDYNGWDKYDADTEIHRIDLRYEQEQAEAKRNQRKLRDKEERIRKTSREAVINSLTLTGTELNVIAEQEREKGNEAFKVGDYEEALNCYNSSITADATINGYNNRAITFIKLRRYNDAVNDCDRVIRMDPVNVKAFLRRGSALEQLEKRAQALADYEAVLRIESMNKIAIAALNRLRQSCSSKKIRIQIEETATEKQKNDPLFAVSRSGDEKSGESRRNGEKLQDSRSSSRRKSAPQNTTSNFTSVESTPKILPSQVCFCYNAPCSSQHSSPLPHIRDTYCCDIPQKPTKMPKSQSIFTTADMRIGKSSVVIEEIRDETYENPAGKLNCQNTPMIIRQSDSILKDFSTGHNEEIIKQSAVISEHVQDESSKNAEKEFFGSKMRGNRLINFHTSDTTYSGDACNERPMKTFAVSNEEVQKQCTAKSGKKEAKITGDVIANDTERKLDNQTSQLLHDGEFDRVESPYDFLRLWHSIRKDRDLILHSRLLKALAPDRVDTVIGNKLDGPMLSTIFRCFEQHFTANEDATLLYRFLQCLAKVERFSIVRMFMDDNDLKVIRRIFTMLEAKGLPEISSLRNAYIGLT